MECHGTADVASRTDRDSFDLLAVIKLVHLVRVHRRECWCFGASTVIRACAFRLGVANLTTFGPSDSDSCGPRSRPRVTGCVGAHPCGHRVTCSDGPRPKSYKHAVSRPHLDANCPSAPNPQQTRIPRSRTRSPRPHALPRPSDKFRTPAHSRMTPRSMAASERYEQKEHAAEIGPRGKRCCGARQVYTRATSSALRQVECLRYLQDHHRPPTR